MKPLIGQQPVDHKTAVAVFGIRDAAESNLAMWISVNGVQEVVILIHEEDMLSQTFENISGRKNCFFVL